MSINLGLPGAILSGLGVGFVLTALIRLPADPPAPHQRVTQYASDGHVLREYIVTVEDLHSWIGGVDVRVNGDWVNLRGTINVDPDPADQGPSRRTK